ncbi:MAG: radical SAM protein [Elusimicrobia bacterium]|nr:radical SAM protein [Elusimicrobiota bacterium]
MAVDFRFVLTGAKRVFDSRPMYAQLVVTDDCNLACAYCDEYQANAPLPPRDELKRRVDLLDRLGVQVYDFLGGEPLLHPGIAELVRHAKSKRGGSNLVTIITNGFLLKEETVRALNAAGLDFMQVSVDSIEPTQMSQKALKTLMPRLQMLAKEARFQVEVQTVLNEATRDSYAQFRALLKDLPFAFGFSIMHGRGGRIAIQGSEYLALLEKYGVFEGVNFYGQHLREMLQGDFSRPWLCLAGSKFLYVNGKGEAQWCGQQRECRRKLEDIDLAWLRSNRRHKPCEPGCALGCVRLISATLGEPFQTLGASLSLALGLGRKAGGGSA